MHSCFIMLLYLYIWYSIIISHRPAGHSTLLTTSIHIPETNTKFPHSWIQLEIHLQIQIQSPCLACFAFVKHAQTKHQTQIHLQVQSEGLVCDDSASIRMCLSQTKISYFSNVSIGLNYLAVRVKKEKGQKYILSKCCLHLACFKIQKQSNPLFWQYCG